jgi:hypothetical protein
MIEVLLGDGRVLAIEQVTPGESMRLAEGTRALSGNRGWCSMALVAASIRSINGIPRPFPTHKKHVEALLKDLDADDVAAIRAALKNAKAPGSAEAPEIEFKKLSPYELLKIYELAGEFNDGRGWIGPATIAASVRKIGDKVIVFPEIQADLLALVAELGMAGIVAATVKMNEALDAADAKAKGLEMAAKN